MSAGNVNQRARCPECGTVTGTFWHNGRRIFQGHGGSMTGDYCPGTGWLVEDDELVVTPRAPRSDAGRAQPSRPSHPLTMEQNQ
mgnify:FL=1